MKQNFSGEKILSLFMAYCVVTLCQVAEKSLSKSTTLFNEVGGIMPPKPNLYKELKGYNGVLTYFRPRDNFPVMMLNINDISTP